MGKESGLSFLFCIRVLCFYFCFRFCFISPLSPRHFPPILILIHSLDAMRDMTRMKHITYIHKHRRWEWGSGFWIRFAWLGRQGFWSGLGLVLLCLFLSYYRLAFSVGYCFLFLCYRYLYLILVFSDLLLSLLLLYINTTSCTFMDPCMIDRIDRIRHIDAICCLVICTR